MNPIRSFLKTTIIGVVVFMIPLVVILMILGKAFTLVRAALGAILPDLPHIRIGNGDIAIESLVYIAAVLLLCFVAGLAARTDRGVRIGHWVEWRILANIPGYSLWQSMAKDMAKLESKEDESLKVGLLETEEGWQFCFLIEHLKDGYVAVFVPEVPNSIAGDLIFVRVERVRPLDIGVHEVVSCIRKLGAGSGKLVAKISLERDAGGHERVPTKTS